MEQRRKPYSNDLPQQKAEWANVLTDANNEDARSQPLSLNLPCCHP
jgi:hypothetical protein